MVKRFNHLFNKFLSTTNILQKYMYTRGITVSLDIEYIIFQYFRLYSNTLT